jgi:hypothetical protein
LYAYRRVAPSSVQAFLGRFSDEIYFKIKYDENTPVSPILVVIRVYKLKKGEQVKNTMATAYEFVRKLL